MIEKLCTGCGETKNIDLFSLAKSKKDGHGSRCKECHSNYRKEHYLENKDKVLSQVKKYKEENPDRVSSHHRVYEKEGIRINRGKTNCSCSVCGDSFFVDKSQIDYGGKKFCSLTCKKSLNKSNFYLYLAQLKKRASVIGKEFTITEDFIKQLLEEQNYRCKITGVEIIMKSIYVSGWSIIDSASLDRIDNSKGYTEGNVQWVCLGINYMKNNNTDEDLKELIRRIKTNQ